MRILVFLAGTTLMHANAAGHSREERVQQVKLRQNLGGIESYIPVGDAVRKVRAWQQQGAEIVYLSPARRIEQTPDVLARHGFPDGPVAFRSPGETWQDVVARIQPDILIEDDCESIGGEAEMTFPQLQPELRPVLHPLSSRNLVALTISQTIWRRSKPGRARTIEKSRLKRAP